MKSYLDTSSSVCRLKIDEKEYEWEAGHEMAEGIFRFMREKLKENGGDFKDITEIHYFSGPGSFTGLRIGASIVNALEHELKVTLFDHRGEQHKIILPEYGREANVSAPKK